MAKPRFARGMVKVPNDGCSQGSSERDRDRAREAQAREQEEIRKSAWRVRTKTGQAQSGGFSAGK